MRRSLVKTSLWPWSPCHAKRPVPLLRYSRLDAPTATNPAAGRRLVTGRCGNGEWRSGVLQKDEPSCRAGNSGAAPRRLGSSGWGAVGSQREGGGGGLSARTVARHAVPQGVGRWAGRMAALGLVRPAADAQPPRPPRHNDPLVQPVAVTEHCVIGDQIRVPAAWCDMAGCAARFADPAALGEADNRARALVAGWCADSVGQLVCPTCQQRNDVAGPQWAPGRRGDDDRDLAPNDPARNDPARNDPAPPAAAPGRRRSGSESVRLAVTRLRSTAGQGRHRRAQWPHLLSALANDVNSWDAQQPFSVTSPGNTTGPTGGSTSE